MSSQLLSSDNNYDIKGVLGIGAFGVVSKIITKTYDQELKKNSPQEYALKQIDLKKFKINERQEALESAKKEYSLLKKNLANVAPAFGCYHDQNTEMFIFSMELFPQNLKILIERGVGKLSFDEYLPLFQDILKGILPFTSLYSMNM